jgi:hypothetical protein
VHAPDPHLSQSDWFVPPVHGSRNIFFGRAKRFGKIGPQVHLQLRQPILVVVQAQPDAPGEPLLIAVFNNRRAISYDDASRII